MKRLVVILAGVAAMALAALVVATPALAGEWTLTLAADQTQAVVGADVTFSGMLINPSDKNGVPNQPIDLRYYEGAVCGVGDPSSIVWGEGGPPSTDQDGAYAARIYSDSAGTWSFEAVAGDLVSNCVTVSWVEGTPASPPPPSNVFLCYSASQTDPGVWPAGMAASLMAQGYWSPYAVKGNVTGGTNVGDYHLVCNLAAGQAAGQQFAGGDGFVPGADVFESLTGAPGWYPVIP